MLPPTGTSGPGSTGPTPNTQRTLTGRKYGGTIVHLSKNDIPVRIDAPDAVARQLSDFGEESGTVGAEYFSLGAGADLDGSSERCFGGNVFHGPNWHTVRVEDDAGIVLFSPQHSHVPVREHIEAKMGLASA